MTKTYATKPEAGYYRVFMVKCAKCDAVLNCLPGDWVWADGGCVECTDGGDHEPYDA